MHPNSQILPIYNYKGDFLSRIQAIIACNLHKYSESLGFPPNNVPFQTRLGNVNLLHGSSYGLTLGGSHV
jgi:hypothetical protein